MQKQGGRVSLQEEESINEKLHESEKLITNLSETWENKLKKTGTTAFFSCFVLIVIIFITTAFFPCFVLIVYLFIFTFLL